MSKNKTSGQRFINDFRFQWDIKVNYINRYNNHNFSTYLIKLDVYLIHFNKGFIKKNITIELLLLLL